MSDLVKITITKEGDGWRCVRERRESDDEGGGESANCSTLEECFEFIRAHGESSLVPNKERADIIIKSMLSSESPLLNAIKKGM